MLAALEIHQASTQGAVGHLLLTAANGGRDIQTTCVGCITVLGKDKLARHFGITLRSIRTILNGSEKKQNNEDRNYDLFEC